MALAAVMSRVKEHTLGCFSSPKLCKSMVKQLGGALSSAVGIVLAHNSSEEDQLCSRSREDMLIYVLDLIPYLSGLIYIGGTLEC